jgi:hypothetical protein
LRLSETHTQLPALILPGVLRLKTKQNTPAKIRPTSKKHAQKINKPGSQHSMRSNYINAACAFVVGMVVYASLYKYTALLPELLDFFLVGFVMGWMLKGTPVLASVTSLFCTVACIIAFGLPTLTSPIPGPVFRVVWKVMLVVVAVVAAGFASYLIPKHKQETTIVIVAVAIIATNMVYSIYYANLPSNNPRSYLSWEEPADENYHFDGSMYLKAHYLMTRGADYYEAMGKAYQLDGRFDQKPGEVLAYRMPTLFYLWNTFLPWHGIYINYAFILLSIVTIISAYIIAAKFLPPAAALLSPILLSTYLTSAASKPWFLFSEFWGALLCIIAIAVFLSIDRAKSITIIITGFLLTVAALIREQLIMVPFIFAGSELVLKNKKRALMWVVPIAVFFMAFAIHYLSAKPLIGKSNINTSIWINAIPDFGYLGKIMKFNCDMYAFPAAIGILVVLAAVAGCVKIKDKQVKVVLASIIVVPLTIFAFVRSGEYWGALFMPFAFTLAPLVMQYMPRSISNPDSPVSHQPARPRR